MLSEKRKERNRGNLGTRLKESRIAAGFTQKALAEAVGLEYYTMISQMELGYISIPAALWIPLADTLRLNVGEWALTCLKEYQPEVYSALFSRENISDAALILNLLRQGQLDEVIKAHSN
ncbi:helix-turn-helix transcriptional regulator [Xinfangfangia sp. CPCC 101601]|uniref:Helix-turn-helix transcriptional regulator n=1 Tax=Pseudogemmobacter lacusdianii TaxID=3069608 RepID=A0ABU0VYQ0_9RHOB|nr:helix-turn-helix transcriptional regulator [Xinfangfangia sp. CPCC 101601]MDQ2066758.1 helix-turn-helix transcriptional regulator [Xinfangfangia sp. CPCC 101601]